MVGLSSVIPVKCQIEWGRGTAGLKGGPSVQDSLCQNALLPSNTHLLYFRVRECTQIITLLEGVVLLGALTKIRNSDC